MSIETWHWLDTGSNEAALNMAVDEALLQTAGERGTPLLRVYQWTRPSISIGYFMEYPEEFEASHEIVRRPTGGGLVYHGQDLTFSFIAPCVHPLYRLPVGDCYQRLHALIAQALTRIGIDCALQEDAPDHRSGVCFESPVLHDIVWGGRKICGGAQRRTRYGLLHQGSLLLPRSQRERTAELRTALRDHSPVPWVDTRLSQSDWQRAEDLRNARYATRAWNRKFPRQAPPPADH